jgi:uncharacterized BrkB/YihY/UPF0761 family membrane protein
VLTIMIVLGVLALGAVHRVLSRRSSPWLGAVVPTALVAGLVYLFARGRLDSTLDYVMAAVALVVVLRMWDEGRQARKSGAATR